ncbi:hypothetical protein DTO045G8_6720 [Paecilomyces variotii]|nr:hypothetical protein DTO045G8_6720 [Paecilomyces variotii]
MAQALDFYLRCNSLKCRAQLNERAVVTTCSSAPLPSNPIQLAKDADNIHRHIFCLQCADRLGLSVPGPRQRRCPACQAILSNPDDAVSTVLNPTEDYKTSVLSGLDPNTIMDCAARALMFWTYQTTQEIFYQEYLGKGLTDKYASLSTEMDKVIHNANMEISNLQNRLSEMELNQQHLHKKNQELVEMYREKCKKHAQMTNLYNLLKNRAMRSQMQTAASDTVSNTLNSLPGARNEPLTTASHSRLVSQIPQTAPSRPPHNQYPVDQEGVEQLHRYQRSGSGSSRGANRRDESSMMPPPQIRPGGPRNSNIPPATPQHRTRLPSSSTHTFTGRAPGQPTQATPSLRSTLYNSTIM